MAHLARYWRALVGTLTVVALVLANLFLPGANSASAHMGAHWRKGGNIYLNIADYASHRSEAEAAIDNQIQSISLLYWIRTTDNPDVFVFDGDYGNTGWCGGAFVNVDGNGHIYGQPQAKYNYSSSQNCNQGDPWWIQGYFCQEITHTWGQGHHNIGGTCMGLGYFDTGVSNVMSPHDNDDFDATYRCHLGC